MVLKSVPGLQSRLKNTNKKTLEDLHFALYGSNATKKMTKDNILSFHGFSFNINSEEYEQHVRLVGKSLSIISLQQLCELFETQCSDSADTTELTKIFMRTVIDKLNITDELTNMDQIQTCAQVKSCVNGSITNSSVSTLRGFKRKSKLLEIQDEISILQDKMFSKQEELLCLEVELSKLKSDEKASTQDINSLQSDIEQKGKLIKIYENRLSSKEKSIQKYEEYFQMDSDSSSGENTHQDDVKSEIVRNQKLQDVQDWTNTLNEPQHQQNISEDVSQNQMSDLARSITNMLARQTIGSQLVPFDGSSCLKWPIFYSEYKLSNETCMFSPKENVLRLNKNLTGDARKTVEMLLVTAQEPDEILDILQKKYGRSELIVDELLEKIRYLPSVDSLESFIDYSTSVRNISAVLQGEMGQTINQSRLLANLVTKLPPHLLTQWGSYLMQKNIMSRHESLKDFSLWVQEMSQVVSRITFISKNSGRNLESNHTSNEKKVEKDQYNSSSTDGTKKLCKICKKGEHSVEHCSEFKSAAVNQRWKMVQKKNICYCCLKLHSGKCRRRKICGVNNCDRFHHNLLHKNSELIPRPSEITTHLSECNNSTLLKIIPVQIKGPNGIFHIFALLDEGSTTTLIDSTVADKLGLSGPVSPLCCKWTGDIYRYDYNSQIVDAEIAGKSSSVFYKLNNIRTIDNLNLPGQNYNFEEMIKKIPFIEQIAANFEEIEKPCLLIGQNNANLIVSRQIIQPTLHSPILSKTRIGWTIHGNVEYSSKPKNKTEISFICCETSDENLHELVKEFMRIENFGVAIPKLDQKKTKEEERAIAIAETSIRLVDYQYEIKLPWKEDNLTFPPSKVMAMQRLICLEKKLCKDGLFAKAYCEEIEKLFEKKYAVPVSDQELTKAERVWFLPHFPVRNPNKPGKVRVVFDAAAKSNGFSLNDFLLIGPDYLKSLFGILLTFRINKIAFAGDIREMFNRVNICYEDTFSQCFLWRNLNVKKKAQVYRMTAMLFGITSSPFLAQFVKNYNSQFSTNERVVEAIIENHYYDDFLDGTETTEEAIQLITEVILVHSRGGFEIRNFICNSSAVLRNIPQHLVNQRKTSELDRQIVEDRILGMSWNSEKDCFNFKLKFHKVPLQIMNGSKIPTKREVLKTTMSVYDPIGLLTPITIKSRILLQTIWRSGIGWDDSITDNMFKKWLMWLNELKESLNLEIPRCYSENLKQAENLQLHTFADASECAYASAVYLRITFKNCIQTVLVASKARVAPLKTLTIPKMELLAAVLGVRLCREVMKHVKININSKLFWSDSRTVLHWLQSEKKLPTYVASRVGEILELSELSEWRWVPTLDNVADDCTRDTPKTLTSEGCRWFKGPQFLYKNEEDWPTIPHVPHGLNEDHSDNTFQIEHVHIIKMTVNLSESLQQIKSHYSWMKLLRITARVKRFIANLKHEGQNKEIGPLTTEELNWSQKQWWKEIQKTCFPKDFENLKHNIENKHGRLCKLSLVLDPEDILRISSRIVKIGCFKEIEKEPIVLDGDHPYTKKMIFHFHCKYGHQGTYTVINELRRKFWIPHLNTAVKKTIRQCMQCRRQKASQVEPKMGLLPQDRLLVYEKPFSSCGIDYFGPFYVKIGRRIEKRYGVLFTCLTVRAIHVEIAHSLSTDSCIMAIRRFLARRGAVHVIWSDNGTNFHGANRELLEALDELQINTVMENMTNRGIKWKFIPPLAPFMGGSWERLIGCFKRALAGIMKERHQKEEVLQTVFAEAEYIINSRPLTQVSDDPADLVSICPNDLLISRSTTITTPGQFREKDLILRKQWRTSQYLVDMFWKRFLCEYIPTLVERKKWKKDDPNIQVGDLVIINDTHLPRGNWPLGTVAKVYQGSDGIVRVADVRVSNGILKRPVRKLHRLNVNCANKEVSTEGENVEDI